MYDASDVIISNLASCNFFWCGLIVPENNTSNLIILCTTLVFIVELHFQACFYDTHKWWTVTTFSLTLLIPQYTSY